MQNLGYPGVNLPVGSTISAAFVSPGGIAGVTGATGTIGSTGPTGPMGNTGTIGSTGPTGPMGATGTIGSTGPTGPMGATGSIGATGSTGSIGSTGNPGINAYSTTAGFAQPAVGAAIAIQIPSAYWLQIGQHLFIGSGGSYQVASGSVPTFSIINLGYSGVNIPVGSLVSAAFASPDGIAGVTGATGTIGSTGPTGPMGNTGTIGSTGPTGPMGNTGTIGSTGPTGPQGNQGSPGVTGVTGQPGINAYSTTAGFTQPAVGAAIAIQIPSGYWIQQNQIVFIPSAGYYSVSSGAVPTFSLQNLGYSVNLPVGSTIAAAFVSPGGIAGVTGATGTIGSTGPTGPQGATGIQGPTGTIGSTGPTGPIGPQGPAGSGGGGGVTLASQSTPGLVAMPAGDLSGLNSTATTPRISSMGGDASGAVQVPSGVFLYFGGNIASSAQTGFMRLPALGGVTGAQIPIIQGLNNLGKPLNILSYGNYTTGVGSGAADVAVSVGADLNLTNNNVINIQTLDFNQEYANPASGSGTVNINWQLGARQNITLTGSPTFTFTNPIGISSLLFRLIQDGSGNRTVTWPASVNWVGGAPPTLSTSGNSVDMISLYWNGISYYATYGIGFLATGGAGPGVGPTGPTGPQGATGALGLNAYSTTYGFTQPAANASILRQCAFRKLATSWSICLYRKRRVLPSCNRRSSNCRVSKSWIQWSKYSCWQYCCNRKCFSGRYCWTYRHDRDNRIDWANRACWAARSNWSNRRIWSKCLFNNIWFHAASSKCRYFYTGTVGKLATGWSICLYRKRRVLSSSVSRCSNCRISKSWIHWRRS